MTVEKVAWEKLHKGDIVVYRNSSGIAVIHRLYELHADLWYVLGDNNASVDREMVSGGNLIGRVCAIFYTATDGTSISSSTQTSQETAAASTN